MRVVALLLIWPDMSVVAGVLVLATSLSCALAAGDVPKCDPAITSKMSEFYPNGIPNNIIATIQKNGLYSYIIVSKSETKFMGLGVRCIGISMPEATKAQVSYKLSRIPTFKTSFPVKEENGILVQTDDKELKLYVIYKSDAGVIFTYRCCDECSGTAHNVGIAVADKMKNNKDTLAALEAAKAKMKELGLDKDVADIPYCS